MPPPSPQNKPCYILPVLKLTCTLDLVLAKALGLQPLPQEAPYKSLLSNI